MPPPDAITHSSLTPPHDLELWPNSDPKTRSIYSCSKMHQRWKLGENMSNNSQDTVFTTFQMHGRMHKQPECMPPAALRWRRHNNKWLKLTHTQYQMYPPGLHHSVTCIPQYRDFTTWLLYATKLLHPYWPTALSYVCLQYGSNIKIFKYVLGNHK